VSGSVPAVSVVVPNWNGRRWLPGCLDALARQQLSAAEVLVVDNGSTDGSLEFIRAGHPGVRLIELGRNTGFARAANEGLTAARGEFVAFVNTDVVLGADWLARMVAVLVGDLGAASVACKMLSLADPARIYDAGDVLRRDGACEQRGRFGLDDGRWDEPGEVFGACAGAALYRRAALLELGGFDERYFAYLEDVDLALRLRLAGWSCRYEPAVALHAGEGSSHQLRAGHQDLVTRNTLVLVAKSFPARWLPLVIYRQLAWAWHALLERRLGDHLSALAGALPLLPGALRDRRALLRAAQVPLPEAVPARPFRGPRAGGHPAQIAESRAGTLSTVPATNGQRVPAERNDSPRCVWCGAEARSTGARLALCPACGTATTYPAPDDEELENAYAGWYRPSAGRFSAGGDRLLAISRASLARRLDRIAPPGPVLDVGAGGGALLRALRARGREAVGLERVAGGDGVLACEIADFDDRLGEWAAVIFWHSLEHLRAPVVAIDRAASLLAPGGVLVIAVPNLASWQSRWFGEHWFHLDLPRHLVHLPASALCAGLRARGFTIERCSYWRGGQLLFGWLHGLVAALPGHHDLYAAIRRPEARDAAIDGRRRAGALGIGGALAPLAAGLTVAEVAAHAGGTIYVEARRR
jgi:hypothetical protein